MSVIQVDLEKKNVTLMKEIFTIQPTKIIETKALLLNIPNSSYVAVVPILSSSLATYSA